MTRRSLSPLGALLLGPMSLDGVALRAAVLRAAVLGGMALGALGCSTGAVGIDDCRTIELARCEEALGCGTVDDVEACRRYYRGHCLHGLPVESRPPTDERDACVSAIRRAGACAREHGADAALDSCAGGPPAEALPNQTLQTACDVVARPWHTTACAFLTPTEAPDGGGGGAANEDE